MRYGSVRGITTETPAGIRYSVLLRDRNGEHILRDDVVPTLMLETFKIIAELIDQLVKDVITDELAEAGWEVIGISDPEGDPGRESPVYGLRLCL